MIKNLPFIISILILLACGIMAHPAQAKDLEWRKQRSLSATELVVPADEDPDGYYSEASTARTVSIRIEEACPVDSGGGSDPECRPVWRLSGTFTTTNALKAQVAQALTESGLRVPRKIILDSQGGGVEPAMWLASSIEQDGVDTEVEDGGTCVSSCVYVLSAGVNRKVGKWALVAVHQQNSSLGFVPESIRSQGSEAVSSFLEDNATTLTIPEVVARIDYVTHHIQHSLGAWVSLMVRTGVSPVLAAYASVTPNPIRDGALLSLSHSCMRALRLDNQADTSPWTREEIAWKCEVEYPALRSSSGVHP